MPISTPDVLARNNVRVIGNANGQPLMFTHGFGGTQQSWRFVAPAFESTYKIVLHDHVGAGEADVSAYDPSKYDSLHGYVDDIIDIIDTLELRNVILVGHSVSGIMAVLAANRRPELFDKLILVSPSPRYINDDSYTGGFTQEMIEELLDSMDSNYLGWSASLGHTIMGNPDRPELAEGLGNTISAIDPAIAAQFARVTFLSDNRRDLAEVTVPTLILQSEEDVIASLQVGEFVHANIQDSRFVVMPTRGHIPNLSHPDVVIREMQAYLA
jgi:sigma-B regulation protein RsbQ